MVILVLEIFSADNGAASTAPLDALGDGFAGLLALEVSTLEVSVEFEEGVFAGKVQRLDGCTEVILVLDVEAMWDHQQVWSGSPQTASKRT